MKCINAAQILPEDLLAEIRRYTNGERLLYIPEESRRKGWGENNGSRNFYRKRNEEMSRMRNDHPLGGPQMSLLPYRIRRAEPVGRLEPSRIFGLSVGHSDDPAIAAHLQLDNPDRKSRGAV